MEMQEPIESVPPTRSCDRCGTPLGGGTLGGFCPRCLAAAAFGTAEATPFQPSVDDFAADLPREFGAYELQEFIGPGSMGPVYRAQDRRSRAAMTIKLLEHGPFANAAFLARLQAELATPLDHPGIVAVRAAGSHERQRFVAADFVAGPSLADRVNEQAPTAAAAVQLVARVARVLEFAHRVGVLHANLKPTNLFLAADGLPRVADFGLGRRLPPDSELTMHGQIVGTPAYLSPEQLRGDPRKITSASDVYSLGAILYWLLAGRPPLADEHGEVSAAEIRRASPPPPRTLNPAAPAALDAICLKCLKKEPGDRPGSAGALAAELEDFLRGTPDSARDGSPRGWLRRWWT